MFEYFFWLEGEGREGSVTHSNKTNELAVVSLHNTQQKAVRFEADA